MLKKRTCQEKIKRISKVKEGAWYSVAWVNGREDYGYRQLKDYGQ
jgi:hypothetical protein